jgi:hypothetical protein
MITVRKKRRKTMRRIFLVVILGLILVWTGAALAGQPDWIWGEVTGEYAFSATSGCVNSSLGFDSNFTPLANSVVWTMMSFARGVQVFHRDGTVTVTGTAFGVTSPPHAGASSSTFSQNLTYTVGKDGTITTVPGPYMGTFVSGPNVGLTVTIAPWAPVTGRISEDGKTITFATPGPPVVETATLNGLTSYEICGRSSVLIRIDE